MRSAPRSTAFVALSLATLTFSPAALGIIGTTECASGDGQVRRTEREIWGKNPVTWIYHGETVTPERVVLDPKATIVVLDVVTEHPELGEEHRLTTVEAPTFALADGSVVTEHVLCRTVEYPNIFD